MRAAATTHQRHAAAQQRCLLRRRPRGPATRPLLLSHRAAAAAAAGDAQPDAALEALRDVTVVSASEGFETPLLQLLQPSAPGGIVVVPFLTHFADLSSWELAQNLMQKGLPRLSELGVKVVTVGLGSPENARSFASTLGYPREALYADPSGAAYKALAFSPGFAPGSSLSPYMKLLTMLAGIGSPGTVQEVLRGYVGDRNAPPVFSDSALANAFDTLGKGYQRPFELATLRLFNMVGILPRWGELSPADPELLVQQGGTLVLQDGKVIWRHDDTGILGFTNTDALVAAVEAAAAAAAGQPSGQPQQLLQAPVQASQQ